MQTIGQYQKIRRLAEVLESDLANHLRTCAGRPCECAYRYELASVIQRLGALSRHYTDFHLTG